MEGVTATNSQLWHFAEEGDGERLAQIHAGGRRISEEVWKRLVKVSPGSFADVPPGQMTRGLVAFALGVRISNFPHAPAHLTTAAHKRMWRRWQRRPREEGEALSSSEEEGEEEEAPSSGEATVAPSPEPEPERGRSGRRRSAPRRNADYLNDGEGKAAMASLHRQERKRQRAEERKRKADEPFDVVAYCADTEATPKPASIVLKLEALRSRAESFTDTPLPPNATAADKRKKELADAVAEKEREAAARIFALTLKKASAEALTVLERRRKRDEKAGRAFAAEAGRTWVLLQTELGAELRQVPSIARKCAEGLATMYRVVAGTTRADEPAGVVFAGADAMTQQAAAHFVSVFNDKLAEKQPSCVTQGYFDRFCEVYKERSIGEPRETLQIVLASAETLRDEAAKTFDRPPTNTYGRPTHHDAGGVMRGRVMADRELARQKLQE